MPRARTLLHLLPALLLLGLAQLARADGFIVPVTPPNAPHPAQYLSVKNHHVKIEVRNQALTCVIDQVFHNDNPYELEGEYIFPVPEGAVVSQLTMEIDGKPAEGKMLPREEAVRTYEDIVRRMRDPMLLEYMGREMFRARIFPIPANGDKHVVIRYEQALTADNGAVEIRYPLSTEKFSSKPLEDVSIAVDIESPAPIASVYSPTHPVDVTNVSNRHAIAGWEAKEVKPDQDFLLYYTVSQKDLGVTVLSTMAEGEKEGYFLLLAAPPYASDEDKGIPKDVVFVLDTSGSMQADGKIEQAREALDFCIRALQPEDRLNVVRFATAVTPFSETVRPVSEARDEALSFVKGIEANGGTNLHDALAKGLASFPESNRPRILVLLSDGNPTVGQTDPETILKDAKAANTGEARSFVWGVGYDVNIHFLDRLAEEGKGLAQYVRPGQNLEVPVSSFFSKLARPVLAEVAFEIPGVTTRDLYPQQIPDFFYGSQTILAGRYEGSGSATVIVRGKAGETQYTDEFPVHFSDAVENDFVPRLWAARKIGFLLDQIRLNGASKELTDEIIQLSVKFGIMTEYTAFLVTEESRAVAMPGMMGPGGMGGAMGARGEAEYSRLRDTLSTNMGAAFSNEAGGWAVSQSANAQSMKLQEQVPSNQFVDAEGREQQIAGVRYVAGRAFYFRNGRWEDASFVAGQQLTQIRNFSDAQFALGRNAPALNQYTALGEHVVISVNGQALEIGPEGKDVLTADELQQLTELLASLPKPKEQRNGALPDGPVVASTGPDHAMGWLPAVGATLLALRARPRRRRPAA